MALWGYKCTGLVPRFHPLGEGLVTFGQCWLLSGENFPSTNHIAINTICKCNSRNSWLLQHNDTALFWHRWWNRGVGGYGGWHMLKVTHSMLPSVKFEWNNVQASHKKGCFPSLFFPLSVEYQSRIFANAYLAIHLKGVTTLWTWSFLF